MGKRKGDIREIIDYIIGILFILLIIYLNAVGLWFMGGGNLRELL